VNRKEHGNKLKRKEKKELFVVSSSLSFRGSSFSGFLHNEQHGLLEVGERERKRKRKKKKRKKKRKRKRREEKGERIVFQSELTLFFFGHRLLNQKMKMG
jgi:hypothetical protein